MPRKPEISLGLGLATATVVYSIYNRMPNQGDIRASHPGAGQDVLDSVRKQNSWLAAGTVAGISLLAKDMTIFILGGLTIVTLDWVTRINAFHNPVTGSMVGNPFAIADAGSQRQAVDMDSQITYEGAAVA
jgi:hypothetical protein